MKKLLLVLVAVISIWVVMADCNVEEKRSKLEELAYKPGIYVRKSFQKIDDFKGMEFSVVKVQDLNDDSYYPGIAISKTVSDGYYSNVERVFIDNDDIVNFNKAIDSIEKSISDKDDEWEVLFRSLGGFTLGYKFNNTDNKWQAYISSVRYRPEMQLWLDASEFKSFKKLIKSCTTKF